MPTFSFSFQEYLSASDFSDDKKRLINQANEIALNAYAPYSKFKVGCAVLLANGTITAGANVENASYPVGICAERTALSHVVTNFPNDKVNSIAISYSTANNDTDEIIFPCGMCRQFILECEARNNEPIELILQSPSGKIIIINQASNLLPFGFTGAAI